MFGKKKHAEKKNIDGYNMKVYPEHNEKIDIDGYKESLYPQKKHKRF